MALFAPISQLLQMAHLAAYAARKVVEHVSVQPAGAAWVFHVAPRAIEHPCELSNLPGFLGNVGVGAAHLRHEKLYSRERGGVGTWVVVPSQQRFDFTQVLQYPLEIFHVRPCS